MCARRLPRGCGRRPREEGEREGRHGERNGRGDGERGQRRTGLRGEMKTNGGKRSEFVRVNVGQSMCHVRGVQAGAGR